MKVFLQRKISWELFCNVIKIRLWNFEEDCLKSVGDRLLMKLSFFALLVFTFHKEPIKLSDFDPLYIKIYLEYQNL